MKYQCLIIDDEAMLSENTCNYFNMMGVKTTWVANEKAALDFFAHNDTDIILLDINLGNASGFDLCANLRKKTAVPILFISARKSDDDVLLALNIGGDDYINKPYSLAVLLAKVNVVLKRHARLGAEEGSFACNGIEINFVTKTVTLQGKTIELKAMEYKLLAFLAKNKNRIVSKDELFRNVWEDAFSDENTLNVHIRRLREKVEENPSQPKYIVTARGKGYVFETSEA